MKNKMNKLILLIIIVIGIVGCEEDNKITQQKVDAYLNAYKTEKVQSLTTVGFKIYSESPGGLLEGGYVIFLPDEIEYLCVHGWPRYRQVGYILRDMYNKKQLGGKIE